MQIITYTVCINVIDDVTDESAVTIIVKQSKNTNPSGDFSPFFLKSKCLKIKPFITVNDINIAGLKTLIFKRLRSSVFMLIFTDSGLLIIAPTAEVIPLFEI